MSPRNDRARSAARRGFTLIELLVAVAIVALLASIVAPSLFSNISDARVKSAKSQLQVLALAIDAFRLDVGDFPTTSQGLQALRSAPDELPSSTWRGPYLRQVVPLDPWGRPYVYVAPGAASARSPACASIRSMRKSIISLLRPGTRPDP